MKVKIIQEKLTYAFFKYTNSGRLKTLSYTSICGNRQFYLLDLQKDILYPRRVSKGSPVTKGVVKRYIHITLKIFVTSQFTLKN